MLEDGWLTYYEPVGEVGINIYEKVSEKRIYHNTYEDEVMTH